VQQRRYRAVLRAAKYMDRISLISSANTAVMLRNGSAGETLISAKVATLDSAKVIT